MRELELAESDGVGRPQRGDQLAASVVVGHTERGARATINGSKRVR
ncbi:hypothetical protein [Halorubrum sp. CBA1125]|nr:hypothetical protein [Halorubrum sp. CBA1125]